MRNEERDRVENCMDHKHSSMRQGEELDEGVLGLVDLFQSACNRLHSHYIEGAVGQLVLRRSWKMSPTGWWNCFGRLWKL